MHRPTFGVRSRFALILLVVVPALLVLAWRGTEGLTASRQLTETLFNDIIVTQHSSAEMVAAMDEVHSTGLSALALRSTDPARSRLLATRIANDLMPAADARLANVRALHAGDDADELATISDLSARWKAVRGVWNSIALEPATATADIERLDAASAHLDQVSSALLKREERDGRTEFVDSKQPYQTRRDEIFIVLIVSSLAAIISVAWLYRGVLPRTRQYSAFARNVAAGDFVGRLDARGDDELSILGRTLDDMSARRQREHAYDVTQLEFAENMQFSEDEPEAHRMLKRHLERTIEGSSAVVLNRNNSLDRLEALTEIASDSVLARSLEGAVPRSCIAVRQARTHETVGDVDDLLRCSVCSGLPNRSTCTPFLVGGQVIGSVLLGHQEKLDDQASRRIRDSVVQAAPVLANLRNLAIAQERAATDSLTGLPNRRSVDANMMRMLAHAGRSKETVAVMLLDLDQFKRVNDRFGHGVGDEVLAAVGAAIRTTVRGSDFAGRYGGEEFIVALPNTDLEGALNLAELLRRAIGEIIVPSADENITASIGIALLPEHAGDVAGLIRAADRALYVAKNRGRNRVETARSGDGTSAAI